MLLFLCESSHIPIYLFLATCDKRPYNIMRETAAPISCHNTARRSQ
ncbi:hypothetical protein HMPREF1992_01727 [Selenomonas sp. oral taxon 892 str. F0426]|nr:hypothetical protein HMPREF1992_01727 [Selenomonas sp. oral taxon 892 str. F0426]